MERFKQEIMALYQGKKAFEKGSWKKESDEIFGPEQIKNVYRSMAERGIIPSSEREIFSF